MTIREYPPPFEPGSRRLGSGGATFAQKAGRGADRDIEFFRQTACGRARLVIRIDVTGIGAERFEPIAVQVHADAHAALRGEGRWGTDAGLQAINVGSGHRKRTASAKEDARGFSEHESVDCFQTKRGRFCDEPSHRRTSVGWGTDSSMLVDRLI